MDYDVFHLSVVDRPLGIGAPCVDRSVIAAEHAGDVDARIQHQLEVVDAAFCAERRKNSTLTD